MTHHEVVTIAVCLCLSTPGLASAAGSDAPAPTPFSSAAQAGTTPTAAANDLTAMDEVQVVGKRGLSNTKYHQALVDIPQTVLPITQAVMQEQAAYTLGDALRNAPSVSAGAGDPGSLGDRVRVRGFTDQEGFFDDGLRDFGTYYRDPFDLEELDVLEGPSGLLFGMGATGGSINQVAKQPGTAPLYTVGLSLGTAWVRRATADLNQPLGGEAALRVAMLSEQGGVPGRDQIQDGLGGASAALGWGQGGPLQLTLGYFHLDQDATADMGLPWLGANPAPIPYHLYYGFADDFLKTSVDRGSLRLQWDAGPGLSFSQRTQFQSAARSLRETIPSIANPTAPLDQMTVALSTEAIQSDDLSVDSQTDLEGRFGTLGLKHDLSVGFEYLWESSDPVTAAFSGVPGESLLDPVETWDFSGSEGTPSSVTAGIQDWAVYAMDTISVGPWVDLVGGLRWDVMDSSYLKQQAGSPDQAFSQQDLMPSWRAGMIVKPSPSSSVYAVAGNSFDPSAEQLALSSATAGLAPEQNYTLELGAKWQPPGNRLLLSGALFRDEQTNARVTDPNNPLLQADAGDELAEGFELSAFGRLIGALNVLASFDHTDSEYVAYASGSGNFSGLPLANSPQQALSLWATCGLGLGLELGAGCQALSGRNAGQYAAGQLETVPGYVVYNAMLGWQATRNLGVQLNVNNLADRAYIDGVDDSHNSPGAARSFTLSGHAAY